MWFSLLKFLEFNLIPRICLLLLHDVSCLLLPSACVCCLLIVNWLVVVKEIVFASVLDG